MMFFYSETPNVTTTRNQSIYLTTLINRLASPNVVVSDKQLLMWAQKFATLATHSSVIKLQMYS